MLQRVNFYLNETIKIHELVKLDSQSIQSCTPSRNVKDSKNSYL